MLKHIDITTFEYLTIPDVSKDDVGERVLETRALRGPFRSGDRSSE